MAKKFVQDIVPGGRRSIRNIPLPGAKLGVDIKAEDISETKIPETEIIQTKISKPPVSKTPKGMKSSGRFKGVWVWVGSTVALFVVIYAVSFMFVSATVTVTPKESNIPVSISGSASLQASEGQLSYTVVSLSSQASKEVRASGEEKVDRRASGKIVIYNNFSTSPQVLIAKTRFETPKGLIFRISDQVTVPGQRVISGVTTPGSVTVTVFADQSGEDYNVGLTDFTIPGFKGDPRFEKFSAKSDPTSPIGGAFSGVVKKVIASDAASAKASIETKLKNDLQDTLSSQIPDTHILFKNASTFSFEELPQGTSAATSTVMIVEKGSIYGIIFAREDLSRFLTNLQISGENKEVDVVNLDSLVFTIDNLNAFNPDTSKVVSFKLSGNAKFVWKIDKEKISNSFVGQKKSKVRANLAGFDSIEKANVSVKPLWFFTLPKDAKKIRVEVQPLI